MTKGDRVRYVGLLEEGTLIFMSRKGRLRVLWDDGLVRWHYPEELLRVVIGPHRARTFRCTG